MDLTLTDFNNNSFDVAVDKASDYMHWYQHS
jgi:hypothetical protein